MNERAEQQIELEGTVESVIFQNPENGYTIFSVKLFKTSPGYTVEDILNAAQADDNPQTLTCIAYMSQINIGENITMKGVFTVHQIYGRQFSVKSFQWNVPTSIAGIQKYLASGVIKGIGEGRAKKIVETFKEDTFKIIEDFPEKLSEIRGITLDKAILIGKAFKEQSEQRKAMLYLQDFGITPAYAVKIYSKYKKNTINVIKTNPYRLADEIWGIGFKIADSIAFHAGIEKTSPCRVKCGIQYLLTQSSALGHVYLPKPLLIKQAGELLDVGDELIENCIIEMHFEKKLWQEKIDEEIAVFLYAFYYAESYSAKRLLEISNDYIADDINANNIYIDDFSNFESGTERSGGIELTESQKNAVLRALDSGVTVITGGPGTGKTTIIMTIIKIFEEYGLSVNLAAPTGRAAKRMTEATGKEAKTLHRLLGLYVTDENRKLPIMNKEAETKIDADVIIVDETSMVDILIMHKLLKAITPGARLIFVGDADQLPSIGPGNVLKDIINSGVINVIKLNEIFRQAQESAIVLNAHRINRGEYPVLNEKNNDFVFIKRENTDSVISTLIELASTRLPNYINCDKLRDIQILTPMRKSPLGVTNLNIILQRELNPPSEDKCEKEFRSVVFREGDKVMQIRNNYNTTWHIYDEKCEVIEEGTGIFNGDEGIITKISDTGEFVKVLFYDGKTVFYDFTQLDELELSYAITIHKSQGSEYKAVIIPMLSGAPMLLNRNLLYTAVTRAKQLVVLVGVAETLYRMVDNNREINRYSTLGYRLAKMNDYLIGVRPGLSNENNENFDTEIDLESESESESEDQDIYGN